MQQARKVNYKRDGEEVLGKGKVKHNEMMEKWGGGRVAYKNRYNFLSTPEAISFSERKHAWPH